MLWKRGLENVLSKGQHNEVVLIDFIQLKTNNNNNNNKKKTPAGHAGINAEDTGRREPSSIQRYLVPSG